MLFYFVFFNDSLNLKLILISPFQLKIFCDSVFQYFYDSMWAIQKDAHSVHQKDEHWKRRTNDLN